MSRGTKDILSANRLQNRPPQQHAAPSHPLHTSEQVSFTVDTRSSLLGGQGGNSVIPPQMPPRRRGEQTGGNPSVEDMPEPQKLDHFIGVLKDKLNKQKTELDTRTDNVNAIQRNFERLSEMYAADRDKYSVAQATIEKLKAEVDDLRAQLKVNNVVRAEFANLQAKMESMLTVHNAESKATADEILALRRNRERLEEEKKQLHDANTQLRTSSTEYIAIEKAVKEEITMAERALNQTCDQVLLAHQVVGLAAPLCGDGIAFLRDSQGTPLTSRVMALRNTLGLLASRALPPVLAHVETLRSQLHASLTKANEEVKTLRKELNDVNTQHHNAKTRVSELERALSVAGGKLDDVQFASAFASERAAQETQRASLLEQQLQQTLSDLKDSNRLLGETKQLLVASQQEVAGLNDRVTELRHSVQTKDTEIGVRKAEIEKLKSEISDMRAGYDRSVKDSDSKGQLWERRQKEWEEQARLQAQKDAMRKREREEDAAKIAGLSQEITQLSQQVKAQREELKAKDAQILLLEATKSKTTNEVALWRTKAEEWERKAADGEKLHKGTTAAEVALWKSKAEEWETKAIDWEKRHAEVNEALEQTSKSLAVRTDRLNETEAQRIQLEDRAKELSEKLLAAQKLAELHKGLSEKEQERAKQLENSMTRWKNVADGNAVDIARLTKEKEELAVQFHITTQKLDFARAEMISAQNMMKKHEKEKETLQVEKESLSKSVASLKLVQDETAKTVKRLLQAEEACESGYSCMACMSIMKDPVICAPCGHSYCRKCLVETQAKHGAKYCSECERHSVAEIVPSRNLDTLSGKFLYRKQVLNDLLGVLASQSEQGRRASVTGGTVS